jgi:hypothetical protein
VGGRRDDDRQEALACEVARLQASHHGTQLDRWQPARAVLAAREAGLRVALEQEPPEDGGAEGEVERLRRELEAVTGEVTREAVTVAAAARFCSRTTGQPWHKSDLRRMESYLSATGSRRRGGRRPCTGRGSQEHATRTGWTAS